MKVPYEHSGRRKQKERTKAALIEAARHLLAQGIDPTVEAAAATAAISRTTAYRYFPNRQALIIGTYPIMDQKSLFGSDAGDDPVARLDAVVAKVTQQLVTYEPEYRAQLRLALEEHSMDGDRLPLRTGRRIEWILDALAPLRSHMTERDLRMLTFGIGATVGIEAMVWLTDMAKLSRAEAIETMQSNARTLLRSKLEQIGISNTQID